MTLYYREILLSIEPIIYENMNCDTFVVGTISEFRTLIGESQMQINVDRAQFQALKTHIEVMARFMRLSMDGAAVFDQVGQFHGN